MFTFIQNFSRPHPDFFTEAWSLSIEEYAYLIGPLLLFFGIWSFKNSNKYKLFLVVTIGIIFTVAFFRYYSHLNNVLHQEYVWSKEIRKVVIYRIDSIYYGFLAAFFANNFNSIWKRFRKSLFSLGIIIFFGVHAVVFGFKLNPDEGTLFFDVFYLPIVSISLLLL